MATEYFVKLWDNNIIQLGVWQTVYMTALTTIFAYLIGLPLGVILWATDKDGLHPNKGVNTRARLYRELLPLHPGSHSHGCHDPGGEAAARHLDRQRRGSSSH
ncbi:MAG: hypothetical protein ACLU3I_17910 [Acutalibacteraceae bacterium]